MSPAIRLAVCALAMAVLPTMGRAAADASVAIPIEQALILRVDGQLTIGAQGVPADYQIKTTLPQKLSDSLRHAVLSWRFDPVLVGGNPVVAHTQMRVTLAAQDAGNAYRIAVDNVTFPQTRGETTDTIEDPDNPVTITLSRKNTVDYPRAALEHGINADALVNLRLTPEGRVVQVFVAQIALLNVKGRPEDLRVATELFERQVLADTKVWRFGVVVDQARLAALRSTDPDADAEAFTVQVPIEFRMQDSRIDNPSGWLRAARTPLRHAPWLSPEHASASVGIADLDTGELAPASEGRFRLSTPVIGTVL